jgi:hypothetical protein
MSKIHFIQKSGNRKTGAIPVTYSARDTCPPSCPHYRTDCYAEDFYTRLAWDKVPARGGDIEALAASVAALPDGQLWRHNVAGDLPGIGEKIDGRALGKIIKANKGKRGFTFTHKTSTARNRALIQLANNGGFTVNLSADDVGHADKLANYGVAPVVAIVPIDTPAKFTTPQGRRGIVCPAQLREDVTCESCGLCSLSGRAVIIGFRAHGTRAKMADARARKVIPIVQA